MVKDKIIQLIEGDSISSISIEDDRVTIYTYGKDKAVIEAKEDKLIFSVDE